MKSVVAIVSLVCFQRALCANILFVAMSDSASHRRSMYPLAEALGRNGHAVTFYSELGRKDSARGENITNHFIFLPTDPKSYEEKEKIMEYILWKVRAQNPLNIVFPWKMGIDMCERVLNEKREEFIEVQRMHWDLIVVDALFTASGIVLTATTNNTPYVVYDPSFITVPESLKRSLPYPAGTTPPAMMSTVSFDQSRFFDRLHATFNAILDSIAFAAINKFLFQPAVCDFAPQASLANFYSNPELSFVDFPQLLDYPRPVVPDFKFIGGKCKTATLPEEDPIRIFVEDPKSLGTIVIAFGHMVKWKGAPDEEKINFAQAVNRLVDYRVIWQFDGTVPVKLGSHVKVSAWLPQTELLNHPKTKLFVSHGGLKSITETTCARVPALIIPFFAEQIRNAFLFARSGSGEILQKFDLTSDNIVNSVLKVITDQSYKTSVTKLKSFIVEKPIPPLVNAVFWTEYVLKHKGLPKKFFKIKGAQLGWITYFMLDVIAGFLFALFTLFSCILILFRKAAVAAIK